MGQATYRVAFPVEDRDRPMGELKAEARERLAAAAGVLGLRRRGPVDVVVTHEANPRVLAEVPVSWDGPTPDVDGYEV